MSVKSFVDRYYEEVKDYLQKLRLWKRIHEKFGVGVWEAVEKIVKDFLAAGRDPEEFDWGYFANLEDYDSVDSFIRDLKLKGLVPMLPEEEMARDLLSELERDAARLGMRLVTEREYKRIDRAESLMQDIKRLRRRLKELKLEIDRLKREKEEMAKKHAEEVERLKKARITMVTVKFLKNMPSFVGVDGKTYGPYKSGDIASLPEANAAVLIEKGVAEIWVAKPPPAPPAKRELTKDEVRYLEDVFKATLFRELGRVPRDAMSEFRLELDTVRTMPLEEAVKHIERLAREIVDRIRALKAKPPIKKPAPPKVVVEKPAVPVGVPPEVPQERPAVPEKPLPKLPKSPISPLSFPRRPTREEKDVLERVYKETLRRWLEEGVIPYPPSKYQTAIRERIFERVFPSWDAVVKEFNEMLEDIRFGRKKFILPVIPWATKEEAILHFFGIGWGTAKDIAEELNREYHMNVTEDEVVRVVKEAWKAKKDPRYAYLTEEELNRRLGI